MESVLKSFSVEYDPINTKHVFSSGDHISGRIMIEFSNECKIDSLCVKLKGKAEVKWTEHHGRTTVTYHKKKKYFSIKQVIIQKENGNNVVFKGHHSYPFTFQIPSGELPSSFKGNFGKILYTLEAVLSRPMTMDKKTKKSFTLINKTNMDTSILKAPQQETINKKMKLFTSGEVTMDANIKQTGFNHGEGVKINAYIQNKSSRDIKIKYCLYKKNSYFAKGKRKLEMKELLKEVGEVIPSSAGQSVSRIIIIPPTVGMSILNCDIIKAEYRLKIYLDVKYAVDPLVKFNIVILPTLEGSPDNQPPPNYGSEDFLNSFVPAGASFLQNPTNSEPSAPPSYSSYGMYPPLNVFSEKS